MSLQVVSLPRCSIIGVGGGECCFSTEVVILDGVRCVCVFVCVCVCVYCVLFYKCCAVRVCRIVTVECVVVVRLVLCF